MLKKSRLQKMGTKNVWGNCEYCGKSLERFLYPYFSMDAGEDKPTERVFCSSDHSALFYRDKYQLPLPLVVPYGNTGVTTLTEGDNQ